MADKHDKSERDNTSTGVENPGHPSPGSGARFYEIHVKGHLNPNWSDWLDGLEMTLLDNGEMILSGPIVDQAALMGVLNKLVHLNLALISFSEVKKDKYLEEK